MKRLLYLGYGIGCHLLFLATYAWLAAFVCDVFVSRSIDRPRDVAVGSSILINLLLVGVFALQHSVMARPAFKAVWTRWIPQPIERSTYVFASCVALAFLIWQWRPIDLVVWDVPAGPGRAFVTGLCVIGWLLVPAVSLMIDHFDLFGSRQVWLYFMGREYTSKPFRTPLLYSRMRHPLYVAWALAFWAAPTMTLGHFVFAASQTIYMVLASIVEERDLVAHFGRIYQDYQRRVPRFVPRLRDSAPIEPVAMPVETFDC